MAGSLGSLGHKARGPLAKEGLSLSQWERDCSHHEGAVQLDEDFWTAEQKRGRRLDFTPGNFSHSPWKLMIGRLVSFLGLPIFISEVYRFTSSYFDDGKSSVRQSARNSSTHVTENNSCHNCFVNEPQLLEIHCRPPAPPQKNWRLCKVSKPISWRKYLGQMLQQWPH